MLGAYVITEITNLNGNLNALNLLSPFKYFSVTRIIAGNKLNPGIVAVSLLLTAAFFSFTYFFYKRWDMNV